MEKVYLHLICNVIQYYIYMYIIYIYIIYIIYIIYMLRIIYYIRTQKHKKYI